MVVLLASLAALVPAAPTDHADCSAGLEGAYAKHYRQVAREHGARAPGRNIRHWGVRYWLKSSHRWRIRDARCSELRESNAQLKRLLVAPQQMVSRAVPPPQPPAGVSSDRNVASLPECTWKPESGGSYTAYNAASGAYGRYQIIPSTWAAHCSDLGRDPAGQERCAVRVYKAQGAGAWVNC
jgi:hypothetical protein